MNIFNFMKKNKRTFTEAESKINKSNYKKYIVKAINLIKGDVSRENLADSEYDLEEIRIASEHDSYIKIALMKYSYMLFKAGYVLKGENEDAVKYIKQRLNIMGFSCNKPIDILFQEIGDDLIKYSNAFLVKTRVKQVVPGIKAKGFLKDDPIGGYFRIDPATVSVERDKNGTIKKYIQQVEGSEKKYDSSEVIHFYMDKEAANAFGTPRIIAALEDVKLLRRIEGNVVSMIYRFAMPLFQWIIGLPQPGFQATDKEIEQAKDEIENMSLDGSVVTNEKTSLKVVGAEGNALSAEGYLSYFEKRVFSALGVSESQMGRGGAKQDADSMESQAHDTVKHIQRVFSIFTDNFIINELLLEGGFDPILNEDDTVHLVFNEINVETKIKVENHEMSKYQSNMITFGEMRKGLGYKDDIDEKDLYKNKIEVNAEKQITKIKGDMALKLSKQNIQSKGFSPKGNGTNKDQEPNDNIKDKDMPQNQHGRTSVKVKESANFINLTKKHEKKFFSIYNKYNIICNDILGDPANKNIIIENGIQSLIHEMQTYINMYALEATNHATIDIEKIQNKKLTLPCVNIPLDEFIKESKIVLENLLEDIGDRCLKEDPNIVFDTLSYRLKFLLEFILPKVYWFSYLKTGAHFNYKKAYITFNSEKDKDLIKENKIDLSNINIDCIPPFHANCKCSISFINKEV